MKTVKTYCQARKCGDCSGEYKGSNCDVDKVKMSLAITNLVENAIKYNRDSGIVQVTLRCRS